jgi:integrase
MKAQLTDLSVRALRPSAKQMKVWDTRTRGFGVLVSGGTKSWFVCYGSKRRLKTLGRYPTISLADARRKAQALLGATPDEEDALSYPTVRDRFLDTHKLGPRAAHEMRRTLLRYFHWKKKLDQITHNDIASAIDEIKAPSEALHAFKNSRTFFNWCVPRYLKHSPCAGLKPPSKYVPRTRVLSPDETKRVWHAVDGTFGTIVKLCVLTGQRWGEVSGLKWEYIGNETITLPPEVTKNGREHVFPLGNMARSVIASVPRFNSTPYLFCGRTGAPWQGSGKSKWQLDGVLKLDHWTLHDLRRTFATNLAQLGVAPHVIERILNHVTGTLSPIALVYNRANYLSEMRAAMALYEEHLAGLFAKP